MKMWSIYGNSEINYKFPKFRAWKFYYKILLKNDWKRGNPRIIRKGREKERETKRKCQR